MIKYFSLNDNVEIYMLYRLSTLFLQNMITKAPS